MGIKAHGLMFYKNSKKYKRVFLQCQDEGSFSEHDRKFRTQKKKRLAYVIIIYLTEKIINSIEKTKKGTGWEKNVSK